MTKTVLIAGASGHFGRNAAAAFAAADWQVRRYVRGSDMAAAAMGADVIVNALNPPNYHNWAGLIPAITAQVIAAAKASGARIVLPGNVYVYGAKGGIWGAEAPHDPNTKKGRIRAEAEAQYRAAAQNGVRTLILRGGDFIDAGQTGTLFSMIMKGAAKGRLLRFGPSDIDHAYAPLPDMARAAVQLAALPDLPDFADIPFAGLTLRLDDLRAEVARQTGGPVRLSAFPWWAMQLAAPFWELARELVEMRYLSNIPHSLDPAPLAALLPGFHGTSLQDLVAQHLEGAPQSGAA